MVCRHCGAPWAGFTVKAWRQPDPMNHDPGIFRAQTNCCKTWLNGKGEEAMVSETELAYLKHYGLSDA